MPDPDPRVTHITLANQAKKFQQSERFTARPTVIEEPVVGEFVTAKGRMLGDGLVVACSPMAAKFAKMAAGRVVWGGREKVVEITGAVGRFTVAETGAMRAILSLVKRADCVKANFAALVLAKRIQSRTGRFPFMEAQSDWTSSGGEEWHQVAGLGAAPFFQQYGDRRRGYAFTPGAEQYFSPTTQAGQNGFAGVFGAPVFSTPAIPMQKKLPVGVEHAGWLGPQFNRISAPPNWPGASV